MLKNLAFSKIFLIVAAFLSTLIYAKTQSGPTYNYFDYGVKVIPHPEKAYRGGEDSYFVSNSVLAVADGVGGWARQGIDPTRYSKTLCINIENILKKNEQSYRNRPKALIKEAADQNHFEGSSTLVIAYLDKENPILRTAYIGDSTYILIRKIEGEWKIIFEAEEQQRAFNMPYQLGNMGGPTTPEMAIEFTHDVQENDIIVAASDGLFDNLSPEQVLKELLLYIDSEDQLKKPKGASIKLAKLASELGLKENYFSPFAQRARKAGSQFMGGKIDDITVVVAQIKLYKKPEKVVETHANVDL